MLKIPRFYNHIIKVEDVFLARFADNRLSSYSSTSFRLGVQRLVRERALPRRSDSPPRGRGVVR